MKFRNYRVSGGGAGAFCGAAGTSSAAAAGAALLVGQPPVAQGEAVAQAEVAQAEVAQAEVAHGAAVAHGDEQQDFTLGVLHFLTRGVLHFLTRGALQHFTLRAFGALQQCAASAESDDATMTMATIASILNTLRVILNSPSQLIFGFFHHNSTSPDY